jgi:hypothetical protein
VAIVTQLSVVVIRDIGATEYVWTKGPFLGICGYAEGSNFHVFVKVKWLDSE